VAAVPLEPVAQLLLAASLVLVEQEIIKVVAPQQVQALAAAVLHQRILHQRQLHRQYQNLHLNHKVKFHSVTHMAVRELQAITQK
jgi:hypothetical protein